MAEGITFVSDEDAEEAAQVFRATVSTQDPKAAGEMLSTTPNGLVSAGATALLRAAGAAVEKTQAASDTTVT